MKLRNYINTDKEYKLVEDEIRKWVEKYYPGLSIEFNWPAPEIVQIDPKARYSVSRVRKIVEVVNIKIGDIMENHAEKIYIAERLDRIYARHPDFDIDVENIDDIKRNPQFLEYLNELVIRGTDNGKLQ